MEVVLDRIFVYFLGDLSSIDPINLGDPTAYHQLCKRTIFMGTQPLLLSLTSSLHLSQNIRTHSPYHLSFHHQWPQKNRDYQRSKQNCRWIKIKNELEVLNYRREHAQLHLRPRKTLLHVRNNLSQKQLLPSACLRISPQRRIPQIARPSKIKRHTQLQSHSRRHVAFQKRTWNSIRFKTKIRVGCPQTNRILPQISSYQYQ